MTERKAKKQRYLLPIKPVHKWSQQQRLGQVKSVSQSLVFMVEVRAPESLSTDSISRGLDWKWRCQDFLTGTVRVNEPVPCDSSLVTVLAP